uniref:Heat shock factor 2-binding protein n=2 Tax=Clastoptera arizonana TaxID=38151 RepID=A0A1B6E7U4_9HEMI
MDVESYTDIESCMNEVYSTVGFVCKNLNDVLKDILGPNCIEHYNFGADVVELKKEIGKLQENISFFVVRNQSNIQSDMQKVKLTNSLEILEEKYKYLQNEWDKQQEHMGNLLDELHDLRLKVKTQSSYSATLGATLGQLLWKVTKDPNSVESLLCMDKIPELFCIANGALSCYVETYRNEMPSFCTDEAKFILSIIGSVANIAACSEGRNIMVTDPNGKELILCMLEVMPRVPDDSGDSLQRVLMMSLYNISINERGHVLVQNDSTIWHTITRYILNDRSPQLKLIALRLLLSLTVHIISRDIYEKMMSTIPLKEIEELKNTTDAEIRLMAVDIIKNIHQAEQNVKKEKRLFQTNDPKFCRLKNDTFCCNDPKSTNQYNSLIYNAVSK